MPSYSPDLIRRITGVLDEIIPAIPVCDATSAHISRIATCMLKAAEEGQTSYLNLLAVASAEIDTISK
ncbi:hypothetical protein V1281_006424 [Nitrobacteraceae bacterium AZCC 2161]